MLNIMDERMINRIFATGTVVMLALVGLQLFITGFVGISIGFILASIITIGVVKAEERRVK